MTEPIMETHGMANAKRGSSGTMNTEVRVTDWFGEVLLKGGAIAEPIHLTPDQAVRLATWLKASAARARSYTDGE